MVGLLIGLGLGIVGSIIVFSWFNHEFEATFNPFYNFVENIRSGGWSLIVAFFILFPFFGYALHDKYERLEKCNVKWKFDEETGSVKIGVTGSKVKDAVINFESKQNCSKNNL